MTVSISARGREGWSVAKTSMRGRGLAGQLVAFTISAVAVAVLAVGAVSVFGVYRLVRDEDLSRLAAYRQLLADDVRGHLAIVERIVESVGTVEALRPDTNETLSRALARVAGANAEYLDVLALTDAAGVVRAQSAAGALPADLSSLPFFAQGSLKPHAWFVWQPSASGSGPGVLWVMRRMDGPAGVGLVLVGRVRTGFLVRLLDEISSGTASRSCYIVTRDGAVVVSGASSVALDVAAVRLTYATGGQLYGAAAYPDDDLGAMSGFFEDIPVAPEMRWRVLVLESEQAGMARARDALLPAAIMSLVSAVIAAGLALGFAARLVAPLRVFERRARDIASGGYVRPVSIDRSDELGRLADAFNEMGVRLNSLQDMAQLLAGASDPEEVLEAVLAAAGHLVGTADVAVLLSEEHGTDLTLARGRGLRQPGLTFSVPIDESSPITAAFRERRPIPFEGKAAHWAVPVFRLFDAESDRSGVAVPLCVGEETLGVVVVLASGRRPLTEAQVETLRAYSAQAAVAVRTARLFEHEHAARREAEALREVAELVAGTHDLDDALDRVAAVAAGLLGMSTCAVAVRDREAFGLDPSPDAEEERAFLAMWDSRVLEPSEATAPEPMVVDGADEPACAVGHSVLLVPLVREMSVLGLLVLTGDRAQASLGAREIALAGTLGKEVSLALEKAALLAEARTRAANLETVFRISQAVSSSLQINVVLNRVLDVVQKIFSADAVSLMAYDPAKRVIATSMARGVANRDMLYYQVAPGEDVPGAVFSSHAPVTYGDLSLVDTVLARLAVAQGLQSLLAVPLVARGSSTGVLTVYDRRPGAFSSEDMELLLTFASQAALAIDTASLYGKEHHVATVLQSSILPERLPDVSGLEAETFYLPAGMEVEIGGDYYDLFERSDGTAVVAIGDVCGKGVLAATKTSMMKHSLRGMVAAGSGPAEALAELNRMVSGSGDPSDIVTVWIGFLDPARRTLTYADGGHPPALLYRRSSKEMLRLEPTGPLLGAFDAAVYEERSVAVGPGDLLMTYTDGVTEARSGTAFFGEARVRKIMQKASTANEAIDLLLAEVGAFSAGVMRDDAAALAVRILGVDDGGDPRSGGAAARRKAKVSPRER
jgi:serine phosphatase RsbU (regulator of sigma subunit)/HAMP domain-containing protein